MLSTTVKKFKSLTRHPEHYLQNQDDVAEEIKKLLKDVYDFTKNQEDNEKSVSGLPELVIKDFDDEQIWQELELQNTVKYKKFISDIPHLLAARKKLNFMLEDKDNESRESDIDKSEDEEMEYEEQPEEFKLFQENDTNNKKGIQKRKIQPSIVDDRFFKLSELEEFLEQEDRKESKRHQKQGTNYNSEDEEYNLFDDIPSDENEMEEGGAHFNEFFDAPEDENQQTKRQKRTDDEFEDVGVELENEMSDVEKYPDKMSNTKNDKQVRFNLSPASSTDDDSVNSDVDKEKKSRNIKSSFEVRQERIQERIKALEEKNLSQKPWQMKGEVTATLRPANSLLEEVLEYDVGTRPAPVVTELTTMKLEDIILQRIKDKVWDDVERKKKPTMAPDEYKKQIVMNQEKSKLSLAEIYEQEYLKQKEALDPNEEEKPVEVPPEHQLIRSMAASLFAKLDALTNFFYTPKPVIPEVKIVSNLPAITMEEVAPVGVSDATLLAPEEVKRKQKGELMSKAERTETDKKRERRLKKLKQKKKQKEEEKREAVVQKLNPGLGNKYSKEKALKTLKKLSSDKNIHQLTDEGKDKGVRSSAAFFSRLQEEVAAGIKGKTNENKKNEKEKEKFSAKKMKL